MTLFNSQIDALKTHIAKIDGKIQEDISDAEVFEYLKDKEEYEAFDCIKNPHEDIDYRIYKTPRTKKQIVADILDTIENKDAYLSFV